MLKAVKFLGVLLLLVGVAIGQNFPGASGNPSVLSRPGGEFYAPAFQWQGRVIAGNSSTGSGSIIVAGSVGGAGGIHLLDGSVISLNTVFSTLVPVVVDFGQAAAETVTPTAVSVGTCPAGNIGIGGSVQCVTITGTFVNTHGQSAIVADASFGVQTAVNYAAQLGGGLVAVDNAWQQMGGTNALLAAVVPFPTVSIQDKRGNNLQFWNANPTTLSAIATPTTLTAQAACDATHTFCSDANVAGTWTSGTLFGCVAYVDIMGNEGACSATASFTTVVSKAVDVAAPAASTGAVGYTLYLSLIGGTYAQAFQVPITSTICTLTKLETVTPACAVANTTYNQSAANAQVAAVTVNTAPHFAGGLSTAASIAAAVTAHTTFGYTPGSKLATGGMQTAYTPFAAVATQATTIPGALGAINLPANFMNFIGKTIRVCGKVTMTQPGSTSERLSLFWDAAGTDTTTVPVVVSDYNTTSTGTAAAWNFSFCSILTTSAVGATGTLVSNGSMEANLVAPTTAGELFIAPDIGVAASAGVNLTVPARLQVLATPTGATSTASTLLSLTLEELN